MRTNAAPLLGYDRQQYIIFWFRYAFTYVGY